MRGNIIKDLLINFLTIITLHCKNNATVVGLLIGSYASPMHTVCAEQHGLVAAEGCTDVPCLTNNTDSRFIYMSMHQTHAAELQGKKRALAVSRVLIGNYSHSRGSDRECGGGGGGSQSGAQHCSRLIAVKGSHFYRAFQSIQNATVQTIIYSCVQIWSVFCVNDCCG